MRKSSKIALAPFVLLLGLGFFATPAEAQTKMLPIPFFSQRDTRWSGNQLGTCTTTIGASGCAMTATAMALASRCGNVTPATLNTWLTRCGGYDSGCAIIWSRAADYDGPGGLAWIGTGSLPTTASGLKAMIDRGERIVAKSTRSSTHWVILVGYVNNGARLTDFRYYDPWDPSATLRAVGDGWVSGGNAIRRYQ